MLLGVYGGLNASRGRGGGRVDPNCIFPNCIFAKFPWITHLPSFASLLLERQPLKVKVTLTPQLTIIRVGAGLRPIGTKKTTDMADDSPVLTYKIVYHVHIFVYHVHIFVYHVHIFCGNDINDILTPRIRDSCCYSS